MRCHDVQMPEADQHDDRDRRDPGEREPQRGTEPRDEVDRIVAAWSHERPDLDFAPLHVLSRV